MYGPRAYRATAHSRVGTYPSFGICSRMTEHCFTLCTLSFGAMPRPLEDLTLLACKTCLSSRSGLSVWPHGSPLVGIRHAVTSAARSAGKDFGPEYTPSRKKRKSYFRFFVVAFFTASLACFASRRFLVLRERDVLFLVFTFIRFAMQTVYSILEQEKSATGHRAREARTLKELPSGKKSERKLYAAAPAGPMRPEKTRTRPATFVAPQMMKS